MGDKAPEGKADLASTVFEGVKTTLQLVAKVADAFPHNVLCGTITDHKRRSRIHEGTDPA